MRTGLLRILLATITVVLFATTGSVLAVQQSVTLSPTIADQPVGSSFALSAFYEVIDGTDDVKGLGVRFHFDSTKLQFQGFDSVLSTGLITTEDQPRNDVLDLDDLEETDTYVSINWFSASNDWPGETSPVELAKLHFTVDVSAPAGDTPVNLSFFGAAGGHTTTATNSVITVTTEPGSITGVVAYTGVATGMIKIGAFMDEDLQNLVRATEEPTPGAFEILDVPSGGPYHVAAFLDIDGDDEPDSEPAGRAAFPVTVPGGQATDVETITLHHIGKKIQLKADPSRISSLEPSESVLTATILDGDGYAVKTGPDATLEVIFTVFNTTYGHIKDGETNPVMAAKGVATIVIESKVDPVGGQVPCTAQATGVQGQGELSQGTTVLQTSSFVIMPQGPVPLLTGETQEFHVTAGTPPFAWEVDGGGKLDKSVTQEPSERVTFTAPGSEALGIKLMVTDDTGLESEAAINVYEPVEIPDKPDDPPIVRVGDTSATFTAEGGDEMFTWTVTDSHGTILGMEEGASYAYTPERTGPFAGPYTVSAADSNGFEDSFDLYVPMDFSPRSMNLLAGESFDLVLAGADSSLAPPPQICSILFLDEDLNVIPEEEMGAYATFSPLPPVPFIGNSQVTLTLTGADVTEVKMFQVQATVSGDPDLTESNGLNTATTGWIRVLPTTTYSGTVRQVDPPLPIFNAMVLFKLGGMPQGDPVSTSVDGSFSVELPSPVVTGSEYDVEVFADNFVSRTDLTTEGWDLEDGEIITLIERDPNLSVDGTVRSTLSSPIEGALVEATAQDETFAAYTNPLGNYSLNLPEIHAADDPNGTWNFQTFNSEADPGCEPAYEETGMVVLTQIENYATMVVISDDDDDAPPFTGTVTDGNYTLSREYEEGDETNIETVTFTLSSGTEGSGDVAWSWIDQDESCSGTIELYLWREAGETITELFARASAPGFGAVTQDIFLDPVFLLPPVGSGDEIGPEGGIITSGDCTLNIPAGALDGLAQIELDCNIPVGPESVFTEHSVTLVEINIIGADINEDMPIQVTIPFDTVNVNPGDFGSGVARINYADTADDLRDGKKISSVPPEDIVFEDHLNGLAGFHLRHTSVFGVGSCGKAKKGGGGGDGVCFIQTATSEPFPAPFGHQGLPAIMIFGVVAGGFVLARRLIK
jgi:hypothetical protein